MVYAKQTKDGTVVAVLTYDYSPQFSDDSDTVVIDEAEYSELVAKIREAAEVGKAQTVSETEQKARAYDILMGVTE